MGDLPTGVITLLFTDIEGSTHLLQQVGARYADLLTTYRYLLRTAIRTNEGQEVDTQGDALFAVFARASDALMAAVAAQRALATYAWPDAVAVRARMGLHTGEPSRLDEGYVGLDLHYAARVMSAAHGEQVLLSQTTRDLVMHVLPAGVGLRDVGEHRLKDLDRPVRLYQVTVADLPSRDAPPRSLGRHHAPLPVQPTSLLGRERDVTAIVQRLRQQDVRLMTLTGPGGTGKTRLGIQVASELHGHFAGAVCFVSLAAIQDATLVLPTIAQALGIREEKGESLLARLTDVLQPQPMLLFLDNFEQVVGAAAQVADLLTVCPLLNILVTSREVLHVRAEHEFVVPPLALPDLTPLPNLAELERFPSVALFLQRARAVKSDFQLTTANAHAVAEICVHLDGLPLAIELAAAHIKLLSPQVLLARLGQRLAMLTSGSRDAPARQQTLRNTIAWSYQLLDAGEQRLFRWLSVFVGGCTLQAAETVCAQSDQRLDQVLEGIASLVDKSLLQRMEPTGEPYEEPYFLMLETLREYGQEALMAHGEAASAQLAHADYACRIAEEAAAALQGPQLVTWLERLDRAHDNIRAALRWAVESNRTTTALRLSTAMERFWVIRGHRHEGLTFLEQALAGSGEVAMEVRAQGLLAAARLAFAQSNYDRGEVLAQESLVLFRELGDRRGHALALDRLGMAAWRQGHFAAARVLMQEALALFRALPDQSRVAWSLLTLGLLHTKQGEYPRACARFEESVTLFKQLGNKRGTAAALTQWAGTLFVSQTELTRVDPMLREGFALQQEVGDQEGIAIASLLLSWVALTQGDLATARTRVEEGLALYRKMGHREGHAEALALLGRVEAARANHAGARTLYEKSLAIANEIGGQELLASGLAGLARVVAIQGEPAWAVKLWGRAEALRDAIGAPLRPIEQADYEQAVAVVRAHLGERAFVAAWTQGCAMTTQQVLYGAEGRK